MVGLMWSAVTLDAQTEQPRAVLTIQLKIC